MLTTTAIRPSAQRRTRRPHTPREYTVTTKGKLTGEQVQNFLNTINMFAPSASEPCKVAPAPAPPLVASGTGGGSGEVVVGVGKNRKPVKSKRS